LSVADEPHPDKPQSGRPTTPLRVLSVADLKSAENILIQYNMFLEILEYCDIIFDFNEI
jgi:hypothetical protein